MPETYLFDIPIYWRSQQKFNAEYDARLSQYLIDFEQKSGYPLTDHLRTSLIDGFWRSYIAPWRFNQVVGWLRLYKLGSQLRGELWRMNAKRAGRQLTKKQFSLKGKAFDVHIYPEASSTDIHRELLQGITAFSKELTRGEVLDLETFSSLAPFVDWQQLMHAREASNPSIERTSPCKPGAAAHLKRLKSI